MVIVITGSRSWTNRAAIENALRPFVEEHPLVIHGGAYGADQIAGEVAHALGMPVEVMPAEWDKHGRSAGPRRNIAMLDRRPDVVLAFWDGESSGTLQCMEEAARRGIRVIVDTNAGVAQ